ncbi:LPS-assembly protein LptD [Paraburkholderia sp. Tr-20389]|nr:LPS-assembly protein LptD [Paraburkholderia sp. Tr-20389]
MVFCLLAPMPVYAQLAGDAASAERLSDEWSLRLAPQLVDTPNPPNAKPATIALGDSATGTVDTDISLKGAAELRRYGFVVKGDALHYDADRDTADAYGRVRIVSKGDVFDGPYSQLRVDANEGFIAQPKYRFYLNGGWGSGARADLLDNERSKIVDGTYSTCACENPAWYIHASQFTMDSGADEGVAYNGVLFFQDVPILASPWLSFPLDGARRSGLLSPTWSMSSKNGVDITVPYYFNIAPNYDLTIAPRYMSKRGEMLSADYRYLTGASAGSLSISWLPDDMITHERRYSISLDHVWNIGSGFSAYVNYNRVSDANVSTDLGSGSAFPTSSTTLYQQEAGIRYNNGPWSVLAREQHWQSFSSDTTYNREPQVNVHYNRYDVGGFDYGFEADATRFTLSSDDATQGTRFVFNPFVSYPIVRPGWFFTPTIKWHFASYDLSSIASDAPAGQPRNVNVSIPTLTLDSGMTFERAVRIFGTSYIQTLEPRLFYVYTPYRNQTYVPLFDTTEADFGLGELFRDNAFVGNDRVSDANRVTAALTSRFIDAATGDERARFVIAQRYDFVQPRVTLYDTESTANVARTSLILGSSVKVGPGTNIENALQYSQANNYLTQGSIGLAWSPSTAHVFNIAYRYTRANTTLDYQPVNQIIVSGQWPLAKNVASVARVNYDMSTHRLIAGLLGLQYDAQCWSLALAFEKYTNATSSTSEPSTGTRVMMQLQLKGLSRSDRGLLDQFKADVPGYSSTPADDAPVSRFSDYQ